MVARFLAHLRPPLVVCGHLVALVLLVLDARREWSAYGLVMLLLVLGGLAVIPAALVESPRFRLIKLHVHAGLILVAAAGGSRSIGPERGVWLCPILSRALPSPQQHG